MKTAIYKGSIQKKFTKAIFFLVFFISFIGYIIFVGWYIHDQKEQRVDLAKDITQVLSQDFVRLILLDDLSTATDLTTKLQVFAPVRKVVLFDNKNKKIFKYLAKKTILKQNTFKTHTSLFYNKEKYGELYFEFEIESIWEILKSNFVFLVAILMGFLIFSLVMARFYAKRFSKPILDLVNFLDKVEFDNKMQEYKLCCKYDDEFGKLYEEINILFEKMMDFILQRDQAKKQLEFIVQYDPLTGLLNKNGFIKSLEKILQKQQHIGWSIMLYVKLTNLKTINHVYSFQDGDLLIDFFAKNIKEYFNDSTLRARIGTGNFALFYKDIGDNKEKVTQAAQSIADALIAILETPVVIESKSIKPEIYIGIDIFHNVSDPLEILKHTNIALEIARDKHKNIVYFDESNEKYIQESFNIYDELVNALKNDELELFYQFQYNLDEKIYAAEALIRWRHPKYGLLTPYKFIPIAERTELIVDIGKWVFKEACRQIQQWEKHSVSKEWVISVNVSAKQFNDENFVTFVEEAAKEYNVNPQKIKLELLESVFVEDQAGVAKKMMQLKELNFNLSLDDFGTGFSSLQYIKVFPLDQIKIDQTFVRGMFENQKNAHIIKSIIYLGSLLDIEVIAEGVEEEKHYKALKRLGCKYFQGYYFAYPRSVEDIERELF